MSHFQRQQPPWPKQETGRRLIGDLLPADPGRSADVFDYAEPGEGPDGGPVRFAVLNGGHDSTFGDVPVVAAGGASTPVLLSAGGAADPLYRLLLASIMPGREVYYIEDESGEPATETTSVGGFLVGLESLKGTPAYCMDVSDIGYRLVRSQADNTLVEGLRAYRARFEDLAG